VLATRRWEHSPFALQSGAAAEQSFALERATQLPLGAQSGRAPPQSVFESQLECIRPGFTSRA